MSRLYSCSKCGRLHDKREPCALQLSLKDIVANQRRSDERMHYYDKLRSKKVWQKKREYIKNRDKNRCVICDSIDDLEVHHIIGMKKSLERWLDNDNLITLCVHCHRLADKGYISVGTLRKKIPPYM